MVILQEEGKPPPRSGENAEIEDVTQEPRGYENGLTGRVGQLSKAGSTTAWEGKEGHWPEVSVMARGGGKGWGFCVWCPVYTKRGSTWAFLSAFPDGEKRLKNCQQSHIKNHSHRLFITGIYKPSKTTHVELNEKNSATYYMLHTLWFFRNLHLF